MHALRFPCRDGEEVEAPAAAANGGEAAPLNLDADISPEEIAMMKSMGIPFGFDTTQVYSLPPSPEVLILARTPCWSCHNGCCTATLLKVV